MSKNYHTCIVVPCFNEAKNIVLDDYPKFLQKNLNTLILFVDDGSTDNTVNTIIDLKSKYPKNVEVISLDNNGGKAEAVRRGFQHCGNNYNFKYIAYLDADLAVSLEECNGMTNFLDSKIEFCFGSRISRIGAQIKRKKYRYFTGRIIATIISFLLNLKVYDTQCGCKIFTKSLSKEIFNEPFISRWLFDVEIFFRILNYYGKEESLSKIIEIPLIKWIEKGDSKVNFSYFFKMWIDLYKIRMRYK